MENFTLRKILYKDVQFELEKIGFDSAYKYVIDQKFKSLNIKILNLSIAQANILKQTALIFGADCAVHRDVITGKIEKTDVILCGSISQLIKITKKLKNQPFKLNKLADDIINFVKQETNNNKTKLIGILNITPDSFSDGGLYLNPTEAQKKLISLIEDGSDGIDIGAESTRPFSSPVSCKDQIDRLKPIIKYINKENLNIPISIDTRDSEVADFALNNGIKIINDVSGLDHDKKMIEVVSKYNAGIVIQHALSTPEKEPEYNNVVEDVFLSLKNKINYAKEFNVENIIIDPGIGFGKSRIDNFKLLENIQAFKTLSCPIMVGISRKRLLGLSKDEENEIKDAFTLAYSLPLIQSHVDYLRVHNVKIHRYFIDTIPT